MGFMSDQNLFLRNIDEQYSSQFGRDGAKIGTALRIRFPADYTVTDGPPISLAPIFEPLPMKPPELSITEAGVIGTAAVLAKNPVLSRRFFGRK